MKGDPVLSSDHPQCLQELFESFLKANSHGHLSDHDLQVTHCLKQVICSVIEEKRLSQTWDKQLVDDRKP
jgi:hypothetical protein